MDAQNSHKDQEKEPKRDQPPPPPPPPAAPPPPPLPPPPPPPSSATSPSHEFSFTITLDPPPFSTSSPIHSLKSCSNRKTASMTSAPSFDVDALAPAEDIFFHGHLLPLLSVAHPVNMPPSDTDISIESFSVPLEHVGSDRCLMYPADHDHRRQDQHYGHRVTSENKESSKTRSFSSFFGLVKLRRNGDSGDKDHQDERARKKKKKVFDMSRFLKMYASMMETLFFFKAGHEKQKRDLRRRPYSFSGHSSRAKSEKDAGWKRKKGQFSAPASLKTSPTNSGLLLTTPVAFSRSVDSSTMEELQSAIQAAIAHCKSSTTTKERRSVNDELIK